MLIKVNRKPEKFLPNFKRVILRPLVYNDDRSRLIIRKVLEETEADVIKFLEMTLRDFSRRHRSITRAFLANFEKITHLLSEFNTSSDQLTQERKLLLGSYFSMEYSIESAAFFNPSIVESPDQGGLEPGARRIILSFRAIGEGHISSIVFRQGIIDANCNFNFETESFFVRDAEIIRHHMYEKEKFIQILRKRKIPENIIDASTAALGETFIYRQLETAVENFSKNIPADGEEHRHLLLVLWSADVYHEINFSYDTNISERVIFPVTSAESNGIEDARFVRFTDDDGAVIFYATYTAYNGREISPKILETKDFYHFTFKPLYGAGARNKNLALFPRKINGKYVMLSRIDGFSNYIMFSDELNIWEKPIPLLEPKFSWEFVQIGNCGSPLETEHGWLVITHGVGPVRKYSLGATLLDLNDPTRVIGRLSEPLLSPNEEEREGYVPNVLYTCGSILHNGSLVLPYGESDSRTGFVTVDLKELLDKIRNGN
ncbi:MAG TPA: glycoside hydrolase family 130 protein [Bacteroidia bacterium]|nr:glycoside hydrolase family 130 protein [Bacteroidia bacterium]